MRVMNKKIWPLQVTLPPCEIGVWGQRKNWLSKNVNLQNFYINGDTYCFKNNQDMFLFTLTWA